MGRQKTHSLRRSRNANLPPSMPTDQPEVSRHARKDSAAVLLESGCRPVPPPTPPGVPLSLARRRMLHHTHTSQREHQWRPPCPIKSLFHSPALRVPRSSPPLPLPSLLQSTCLPELAEPPERGEPISLLFEAFFDLLTMEY